MNVNDPIGDMLTRIRNAIIARKRQVLVPASKLKERIAEILHEEGYVESISRSEDGDRDLLLSLRYGDDNQSVIQELRRMSRPGQRRYVGKNEIPKVRSGLGIAILSTSRGVVTDTKARTLGVGGEYLCEVW